MIRSIVVRRRLVAFGLSVAAASPALAQAPEPNLIDRYKDWRALTVEQRGAVVCYMLSEPVLREGDYARRGPSYVLVTHRPARDRYDVVTVIAGYTYEPGSTVHLKIGDQRFELFTSDNTAWAEDAAFDKRIAEAIRRGAKMVVEGVSSRGTETTDIYSLSGSNAAYEAISAACR